MFAHLTKHMHTQVYSHKHTNTAYIPMCTHTHTHTHTYMLVCMHMHTHYMHACMHTHPYTQTRTHTHMHTKKYIFLFQSRTLFMLFYTTQQQQHRQMHNFKFLRKFYSSFWTSKELKGLRNAKSNFLHTDAGWFACSAHFDFVCTIFSWELHPLHIWSKVLFPNYTIQLPGMGRMRKTM